MEANDNYEGYEDYELEDSQSEELASEKERGRSVERGIFGGMEYKRDLSPERSKAIRSSLLKRIDEDPIPYAQQDTNIRGQVGEELVASFFNPEVGGRQMSDDYVIIDCNEIAVETRTDKTAPGVDFLVLQVPKEGQSTKGEKSQKPSRNQPGRQATAAYWIQLKTLTDGALTGAISSAAAKSGYGKHMSGKAVDEDAKKASKWLLDNNAEALGKFAERASESNVALPQPYADYLEMGGSPRQDSLQKPIADQLYFPVPFDQFDAVKDNKRALQLPYDAKTIEGLVDGLYKDAQKKSFEVEKQKAIAKDDRQGMTKESIQKRLLELKNPQKKLSKRDKEEIKQLNQSIQKLGEDGKREKMDGTKQTVKPTSTQTKPVPPQPSGKTQPTKSKGQQPPNMFDALDDNF